MSKDIVHESRNEAQNFLTRANKYTEQPELFKVMKDEKGNVLDAAHGNLPKLSRKDELRGTGIAYLTSFIDFMCTHHKDAVVRPDQGEYYSINGIDFSNFLDAVTGGHKDQRRRAVISLYHIIENPKPKTIYSESEECYFHMQPFVFTLKLNGQAINDIIKRRLNNLKDNHEEDPAAVIEEMVSTIDILFAKPLFEGFFKKSGFISLPTALYAYLYDELHGLAMFARGEAEIPKSVKTDDTVFCDEKSKEWQAQLDSSQSIDEIANFMRYICLHNNITKEQHKSRLAPFTVNTTVEVIPMLKEVAPRLLDRKDGKLYYRQQEFTDFITGILAVTNGCDIIQKSLDFCIIDWKSCDGDKIQFTLTNDKEKICRYDNTRLCKAKDIERVQQFAATHPNYSIRQIAKELGISKSKVQRYLK